MPRGGFVPSFGNSFCSVALWVPLFTVLAAGGSCVCGTLTDGEVGLGPSSSRPVAVRPRMGLGLLLRPGGCCRSPARCLAGFSSLGWLAGCSPGCLPFRAAGLCAGCLGFYASFLPGEGSWFLRLAWRYGCCFWRRPFP